MSAVTPICVRAYPKYPSFGGAGWRGIADETIVLDWDYVAATLLRSDYGMEVRIKLQHDAHFTGTYATATFYCLSSAI